MRSAIPALWLQRATPALRIRFGTLRLWCVKFLARIFYSFWAPHSRKLRIGLFDRRATKFGQLSKFFPWGEYFAPELDASGSGSFTPGFFTHFGRPTGKNFDSVVLTKVRPNGSSFQIFPIFSRGVPKMDKKS